MSANNYILVKWNKDHYEITHRDADTNYVMGKALKEKTLEDAILRANALIQEIQSEGGYVEYGLSVIPRPKNATSIRRDIQGQGRIVSNDHSPKRK